MITCYINKLPCWYDKLSNIYRKHILTFELIFLQAEDVSSFSCTKPKPKTIYNQLIVPILVYTFSCALYRSTNVQMIPIRKMHRDVLHHSHDILYHCPPLRPPNSICLFVTHSPFISLPLSLKTLWLMMSVTGGAPILEKLWELSPRDYIWLIHIMQKQTAVVLRYRGTFMELRSQATVSTVE